jgi:hypothetical protein
VSTSPVPPQPFGRKLVEQARRLETHPNTLIRWIKSGVKLRDGSRLQLRATLTPGGWRLTDSDINMFYSALTADRLGQAASTSIDGARSRRAEAAAAQLEAAGW